MNCTAQTQPHPEPNQLLTSDKSRPSLPSTLKISEEEFTSEGSAIDLSSSRRTSSSSQVNRVEGFSLYQTEQEQDDDSQEPSNLTIEIYGELHQLDVSATRNFEEDCERLAEHCNLPPTTMLCIKIVLLRDLRQRNYRFAALYSRIMNEYMQSKFEELQCGD